MRYINPEVKRIDGVLFDENGLPLLNAQNAALVDLYVKNESSYSDQSGDDFVRRYFKAHKGDVSMAAVITKIILIDTVDSTNLKVALGKDYYKKMAKKIINDDIESLIAEGAPLGEKFKEIACFPPKKRSKKKDLNLFIFVSKYITRVNQYSYDGDSYKIGRASCRERVCLSV